MWIRPIYFSHLTVSIPWNIEINLSNHLSSGCLLFRNTSPYTRDVRKQLSNIVQIFHFHEEMVRSWYAKDVMEYPKVIRMNNNIVMSRSTIYFHSLIGILWIKIYLRKVIICIFVITWKTVIAVIEVICFSGLLLRFRA